MFTRSLNKGLVCLSAVFLACSGVARAEGLGRLTLPVAGSSQRASSSSEDLLKNGDAKSIACGETLVLLEAEGPGEVTHLWNTIGTEDFFHGRSVVVRVYYDGMDKPSVEAPLGDFFGVGHGAYKDFTSAPVSVSSTGRSRSCYWRMPFRKSIKITVTNDSPTIKVDSFYYYVDWQKLDALPEETLYFHAQYRQECPVAADKPYVVLDTRGRGQYVGTVLSAHQMETGWFGEGDDFFYIDGGETPRLRGTGTEDYFNDAWGFREFCTPYYGVPLYEGVLTGDRVTAYRWHIEDPVTFSESLRFEVEHKGSVFDDQAPVTSMELGGFLDRGDWYSSVAFWYQQPAVGIAEPLPPVEARIPPYKVIKATEMVFTADPPLLILPQGPLVLYAPGQEESSIEFQFHVAEDGRYRLDGIFMFSLMGGVYQPMLDGKEVGDPLDLVIPNADYRWVNLDIHDLKAGQHTLRFEGRPFGKALRALATTYHAFGIGGVSLLRLDDMDGYQRTLREKREAKKN